MSEDDFKCPCCGEDISEFVHAAVVRRIRQINAEKMRRVQNENPEKVRAVTTRASHARTEETFVRQGETLRETNRRKAIKFSELLLAAKQSGQELTTALQSDLMKQASALVKEEMKAERRAAKKNQKQSGSNR